MIEFIYDILVYSLDQDKNKEHLGIILQALQDQLYDKFTKCEFQMDKVEYLGHVISTAETYIDLEKIEGVVKWERHNNVTQVRSVHGLVAYYHLFVEGFS